MSSLYFGLFAMLPTCLSGEPTVVQGITLADSNRVYVSIRELAAAMRWKLHYEPSEKTAYIEDTAIRPEWTLRLPDGRTFVAPERLVLPGLRVEPNEDDQLSLSWGAIQCNVLVGKKRIEINLTDQELVAYQGDVEVLRTPISSGRPGYRTPTGTFTAGPAKRRMHYSSLYDNAPMPYSIQVVGNVFLHGYHSVPRYPASHGCIRVPLRGWNPAKWLFDWTDIGTEIRIYYEDEKP